MRAINRGTGLTEWLDEGGVTAHCEACEEPAPFKLPPIVSSPPEMGDREGKMFLVRQIRHYADVSALHGWHVVMRHIEFEGQRASQVRLRHNSCGFVEGSIGVPS